jgi:hypothetical protein
MTATETLDRTNRRQRFQAEQSFRETPLLLVPRHGSGRPRPARWLTISAHGQFEPFVRAFGRQPTRPGLPEPSGSPTPEQAAALAAACRNYGIEIVGPPWLYAPRQLRSTRFLCCRG